MQEPPAEKDYDTRASKKPVAARMYSKNAKDPFDNDLVHDDDPQIEGEAGHNALEVDMDFSVEEDEEEDMADKDEEDHEKRENAENMDILSELQMKQQEIAMKKDGLLSTEQNSMEEQQEHRTPQ